MSYSIMYNRVFIKSNRGLTPCILAGDSNVWEGSGAHQRRVRDWNVYGNLLGVSAAKLKEYINPCLDGRGEHWKSNGKWVDDAGLVRWVESGIRGAMTMEELIELNPRLSYGRGIPCRLSVWENAEPYAEQRNAIEAYVKDTDSLDAWIDQANAYIREHETGKCRCYPIIDFGEHQELTVKKPKAFAAGSQVLIKHNKRYLTSVEEGAMGGYAWSFHTDPRKALEMSYEKAVELLKEMYGTVKAVNIVSSKIKDEYDPHIVCFSDGRGLHSVTSTHIYTCVKSAAKKYPTRRAAEKASANPSIQSFATRRNLGVMVEPIPADR